MRRLWILVPLLFVVVPAESASAQLKAEGIYIGGSVGAGLTKLNFDELDLLDDTSVMWKAVAGYRKRFFAIEFDYRAMEQIQALFPGSEVSAKASGFTGSLLLILPAGPIDIFGRAGGHYATTEIGIGAGATETKAWSLLYGGGIGIRVGSFALRAEYERPQIETITELHQVSAGITVAF